MRRHRASLGIGLVIALTLALPAPAAETVARYVDPDPTTGSSKAVIVGSGHLAHTAQLLPLDADGNLVGKGRAAEQIAQTLANLERALKQAGTGLDRAVKVNVYAVGPEVVTEVKKAFATRYKGDAKPAVSFVTGGLAHPDALVALDAVAVYEGLGRDPIWKARVPGLPGTKGGTHVAVLPAGGRVHVAGQAEPGKLPEATRKTLQSLRSTLAFLGLGDRHIVQLKCFVQPITRTEEVEKELAKFYGELPVPPVVFVEWQSSLTVPIEIELVASTGGNLAKAASLIEYLTPPGMTASPIFSRVARTGRGGVIYTSGLYGKTDRKGAEQVTEIFTELDSLMKKTGSDLRHLAKATYYVSDDEASRTLNELRPRYYDPKRPPAASKAVVKGVGVPGKTITLDMIAVSRQ